MDEREIRHLVDRINRIERASRRWRILGLGASIAIALLLGLRWVDRDLTAKSIRAMELVIVDASGRASSALEKIPKRGEMPH